MTSNGRDAPTAFVITHESNPNRRQKYKSLIALALMRSLGRHGVPVVRIHPNRLEYSLSSRYCTAVAVSPDMYDSESALVEYLLRLADEYPGRKVLLPASDDCAQFLGKYKDALKVAFDVCVADPSVMALVINKQRQYENALQLGIPIPETYFPKSDAEFDQIVESVRNYPYIIKPLIAHKWRLASMQGVSKGRKAVRVANADELRAAYETMGEAKADIMIQEVIGGRDEELFTFLGYFRRDSAPLAYCVRRKVRQMPIDFGYCTNTVSCHDDIVVEQSVRLLQGIGYSGIVGVEFKFDQQTGKYKLIEINARPVNTIGIAPACGVDIPYVAYRDLLGDDIDSVTTWRDGVRWHQIWLDYYAVKATRKVKGKPSTFEWLRSLRGESVDAVFARDDLKLSLVFYLDRLLKAARAQFR